MRASILKTGGVILAAAVMMICFCTAGAAGKSDLDFIEYPDEAITRFDESILDRISTGDDYLANRGYDETSLYISPYWTLKINGESVPVYATAVYDWKLNRGVLQSFQYIFTNSDNGTEAELSFSGEVTDVTVLPEKYGCRGEIRENKVFARINAPGAYTFLINGDSQEYAVTLFFKPCRDEEAEIAAYREQYGEENVAVFEKGYYELEELKFDGKVTYFRKGAFISAAHIKDIRSADDAAIAGIPPFAELNSADGYIIDGLGTVDFTRVDRQERNLFNLNYCQNSRLGGLILLNPNSWTVTTYASEYCELSNITVFGYRTNSDGINICGSAEMTVKDCFCRNGDDCFSVKATNEYYECRDVTFTDCIGWSNKARCFGVTGETVRDIYNITFSDCAVIYRNAVWDNDRVGSLAVAAEVGNGRISNIVFEDIEIYHDDGRAIYCMVYGSDISGCKMDNIVFRNINYSADEKIKISAQREISRWKNFCARLSVLLKRSFLSKLKLTEFIIGFLDRQYNSSNSISVSFENVCSGGVNIASGGLKKNFIVQGNAVVTRK